MTKSTRYLLVALLKFATLKMAAPSSNAPIGLTPAEFETIIFSSCPTELAPFPNNGLDVWKTNTQLAFAKISSSSALHPFVVCNRTPGMSGNKRKKALESLFENAIFSEFPMYNSDDKTCILIRASGEDVRGVGETSEINIQPLLPVMKTGKDVVENCKRRFGGGESTGVVPVRVTAMLGPGVSSDGKSAEAIGKQIIERMAGMAIELSIKETFPSSEREIIEGFEGEILDDGFFTRVSVASGYNGESVVFDIKQMSSGLSSSKILAFLAQLASQPEVTSVDVQGETSLKNVARKGKNIIGHFRNH